MTWLLACFYLLLAAAGSSSAHCVGKNALHPNCSSSQSNHRRDVFYVNGRYVYNATARGTLVYDQMYVEKLTPASGIRHPHPLVLFHSGGASGAVWLQTPDNRKGWASWFLEQGYITYIVDQTSVGRSSQQDFVGYPLRIGFTTEVAQGGFTVPEQANEYPQSQLHTQWPGAGVVGDPIFDAFVATFIPQTFNNTRQELSMRSAGCELLSLIGPSFLLSHSIGALYPILLSDECPELVLGSVNLEPATIPFQSYFGNATNPITGRTQNRAWGLTNTPITYDPPASAPSDLQTVSVGEDSPALRSCILQVFPPRQLPNIAKVPYIALTGEASPHITYDHCIIDYLRQAGVAAEWIKLAEIGIRGNGHFFFLEKNNLEIVEVVDEWIQRRSQ